MSETVSIHWYRKEYEAVISYKISSGQSLALGLGYKLKRRLEDPCGERTLTMVREGRGAMLMLSHRATMRPAKCCYNFIRGKKRLNVGGTAAEHVVQCRSICNFKWQANHTTPYRVTTTEQDSRLMQDASREQPRLAGLGKIPDARKN